MGIQTDANENHIIEPFVPTTTEIPMEEEEDSSPQNCGQMHISAAGELIPDRPSTSKDKPKSAWAALFGKKKGKTSICILILKNTRKAEFVVVVVLLFYIHGKHLRSCQDGQLI